MAEALHRRGDQGPVVAEIRDRLRRLGILATPRSEHEDIFDADLERAVREFQQQSHLIVDGIVGPATYQRLEESRWQLGDRILAYRHGHLMRGHDVAELQQRLSNLGFDPDRIDGIFGKRTERAVRDFQHNMALASDGTVGPDTVRALTQLRRAVVGGQPHLLREEQRWESARTGVADKVIVLDPAHGGPDDPGTVIENAREAQIVADIAARVEGRLAALGVTVLLTRSTDGTPATLVDEHARAFFANTTGADVAISLHLDATTNPDAHGVASFFYGQGDGTGVGRAAESVLGRQLATVLLDEICARTDAVCLHAHPKTWDMLRETRMTAVRLELGYLSNPRERANLMTDAYRDALAEAIAASIVQFFSPQG